MPYPAQLAAKERFFLETLGDLASGRAEPILPSPDLWHYRNKMEFSFGYKDGRSTLGLHLRGQVWGVMDVASCDIFSKETAALLTAARDWAVRKGLSPYHSRQNVGELRHMVIREGKNTGQRMVNLITTPSLVDPEGFLEALQGSGVPLTTVLWSRAAGVADVARGELAPPLWGQGFIEERIGNLRFKVSPYGFMQTNTRAAEGMIALLSEWLDGGLPRRSAAEGGAKAEALLDLYCGSGLLGLSLAGRFGSVMGLELNEASVEAARVNADMNGIMNVHFKCGTVEEELPRIAGGLDPAGPLAVIVDPPRAGLHKKVIAALMALKPDALIYVSCNPVSLARDLAALRGSYRVERLRPMDFYPHTPHVEAVACLRRASGNNTLE